MATPVDVYIEAVQHTPDRSPVLVFYKAATLQTGPLATSTIMHTTQEELSALALPEITEAMLASGGGELYWGDRETKAKLVAHLAEHGIDINILSNDGTPPPAASSLTLTEGDGNTNA